MSYCSECGTKVDSIWQEECPKCDNFMLSISRHSQDLNERVEKLEGIIDKSILRDDCGYPIAKEK